MNEERDQLLTAVRSQAGERQAWERAGTHLAELALRHRLAALGVDPSPELGVGLMAAAMLLAEGSPEWGGDFRDALAEVAALGLGLLADGGCASG